MKEITVSSLQRQVHEFAEEVFGPYRQDSAWKKLFEEIGETLKNPEDPAEWADVFILMLDLVTLYGIDVGPAIVEKLHVLRSRTWRRTLTGTMQHIPGGV